MSSAGAADGMALLIGRCGKQSMRERTKKGKLARVPNSRKMNIGRYAISTMAADARERTRRPIGRMRHFRSFSEEFPRSPGLVVVMAKPNEVGVRVAGVWAYCTLDTHGLPVGNSSGLGP